MTAAKRLPRRTPESQGVPSSAIHAFVTAVEQQISELHAFVLLRHGSVVAEGGWSPYGPQRPHMLYSLSKSFTSTAIGLAVAEGRLSIDDPVLPFFPDEAPARVSRNLAAMQIRHLLGMSTGHAADTMDALHRQRTGSWVKAFLSQPVKYKPGTHFLYNTGATYMLSAILQKVTGQRLVDYLQPRLFGPLGIQNPTWELSPQGINTGGYGLSITTEDIACFGQLYLQKGRWHGQQIVPAAWIEQATTLQTVNGDDPASDWEQGYGYQFWRCRHGAYRGDGAFGQYCVVMPEQDAVLAINGGLGDMQPVLNLVWEHLLPALSSPAPLPDQPDAQARLTHKLDSLAYAPPQGPTSSPTAARVSGMTFVTPRNGLRARAVSFDFSGPDGVLTLRLAHGSQRLVFGYSAWRESAPAVLPFSPQAVASGVWTDDDTLVITLRFYETPYVHTLTCHFAGDQITIDGAINVSFGPTTYTLNGHVRQK